MLTRSGPDASSSLIFCDRHTSSRNAHLTDTPRRFAIRSRRAAPFQVRQGGASPLTPGGAADRRPHVSPGIASAPRAPARAVALRPRAGVNPCTPTGEGAAFPLFRPASYL